MRSRKPVTIRCSHCQQVQANIEAWREHREKCPKLISSDKSEPQPTTPMPEEELVSSRVS